MDSKRWIRCEWLGVLLGAGLLVPLVAPMAAGRGVPLGQTGGVTPVNATPTKDMGSGGPRTAAPVILNEYDAVDPDQYLELSGSDVFFGRVVGNGGNWFELVITQDQLDMRNWQIQWQEVGLTPNKHGALTLTNHALWSNMRAGTILTFTEWDTAAGGLNTNTSFDPALGDWWININTLSGGVPQTTYVTTTTDVAGDGPGNFSVGNKNWQLRVLDASSNVVFGWAGEGLCGFSGVNKNEVGKLEENPSSSITCYSTYHGGNCSTFGNPNCWSDGAHVQDFSQLRTPGTIVALVATQTLNYGPDEVTSLPSSLTSFTAGQVYYLEVWAQTMHSTGLATVSADIRFEPSAFQVDTAYNTWPFTGGVFHSFLFNALTYGTVNNSTGLIDDLSGAYLPGAGCTNDSTGVEPGWSRVAVVRMLAQSSGANSILVDQTHSGIYTIGVCGAGVDPALVDFRGINEPAGQFRLDVPNPPQTVMQGGMVTVNLSLANLNQATNGIQALFHYNPVNLDLISITPNTGVGWSTVSMLDPGNGDVEYAAIMNGSSVGPGAGPYVVATLTFQALDDGTPRITFLGDSPSSFPTLANRMTEALHGAALSPSAKIDTVDGHIVILPCNDNNICTTDEFNDTTRQCVYTPVANGTPCPDGNLCNGTETCQAGVCTAGTPLVCNDSNPCTDDTCNPATGECVFTNNDANSCSDGNACNGVETCHSGACVPGTPLVCNDGNPCTDDTCNPATGECVFTNNDANSCSDGNACNGVETCHAGTCVPGTPLVCDDHNPCTDDTCNPATGECVFTNNNANTCSDGNACTQTDVCVDGACVGSNPKVCNDNNPCTDDTCNPVTGECVFTNNNANTCSDGNACTQTDACVDGACVGSNPKVCNDNNPCTDDTCNPATGECAFTNNNANTCSDGNACTQTDACVDGACVGSNPKVCNDNNPCTDDTCNPATGECAFTPDDNNSCADSVFCNGVETCVNGSCQQGSDPCLVLGLMCDEAHQTCVGCLGDADCDDSNACNGLETCQNGTCVPGTPLVCNDGNPCTDDTCNPATGECVFTNNNANTCSDGNACTQTDACVDGACVGSNPRVCNDGNPCTDDTCNPATGECVFTNNDANSCSDGNACNGVETCHSGTCVPGTPLVCDDHNLCTDDTCNPATGECVFTNNNANTCSDGNACTQTDVCVDGACVGSNPKVCNDNNPCTDDTCNPATGECAFTNNNANTCSDGNACTQTDACVDGACVGSNPRVCNDNNPCTDDTCNPATGECAFTNNNANTCSDGNACTQTDACVDGACVGSNPKVCNDNNPCTDDTCNPATGECAFTNNTAPCDDGLWCTVNDVCANGTCQGTPRDCSDSLACTADTCDEVHDTCVHTDTTQINVTVQVEGLSRAVTRSVTFVITACNPGGSASTRTVPVSFNTSGVGNVTLTGVDTNANWIQATEGHTLSSLLPLNFGGGCTATVSFTGADILRSGDFSNPPWVPQDALVDIQDFSILAIYWNQIVDANLGSRADATGDGLQGTADFTLIQANFAAVGDPVSNCPQPILPTTLDASGSGGPLGTYEISVDALGIPGAEAADRNGDGMIDVRDIRLFAAEHNLSLTPAFSARLDQIERTTLQNPRIPGGPGGAVSGSGAR